MDENAFTFEIVEEVNLERFDPIVSLRDFLREMAHDFKDYARQFSLAATMLISLSEASAMGTITNIEAISPIAEYVLTEDNISNQAEVALEKLFDLDDDWDGYDAPAISRKAIENCRIVIGRLSYSSASDIQVLPTEYGGVQIKKVLADGSFLSCDFSDDTMSYYIEKNGKADYFPFLSYSGENVERLAKVLV